MKMIVLLIMGLAVLAKFGSSDPLKSHTPPGKRLYQSLPRDDRRTVLSPQKRPLALCQETTMRTTSKRLQYGRFDEKRLQSDLESDHPEYQRLDFLAFSLGDGYTRNETKLQRVAPDFPFPDALGINGELLEKFKSLNVPRNFTTNLYVWIRAHYDLDTIKMRTLILNRSVCLSNGQCIDIGDIGALCCPF